MNYGQSSFTTTPTATHPPSLLSSFADQSHRHLASQPKETDHLAQSQSQYQRPIYQRQPSMSTYTFANTPPEYRFDLSAPSPSANSPPNPSGTSYGAENTLGSLSSFSGNTQSNGASLLPPTFDPTDYTAQGLDESAFSSGIAFQMPSFLTNGAPPSELFGPAFLAGNTANPPSMQTDLLKLPNTQTSSMPLPVPQLDSSPSSIISPAPVYGMYGSSFVGVSDDPRPFKKYKQASNSDDEPSYVQRDSFNAVPDYPEYSVPEETFDPTSLGLPAPHGGNYPGLYSESGFDLVGVLARVVARPNPIIDIGPIDSSTAFVVCDARRYDYPIVYASETFSRLTGYSSPELLGRNCRFLQSPSGKVERGSVRTETDGRAVHHLGKHIHHAKECQTSLVNYKKSGEAFINLVTIVPITWDSDEITYFVGFQVNLVDQPNAILDRMRNGTYVINYTLLPDPPGGLQPAIEPKVDEEKLAKANAEKQQIQVQKANIAMRSLSGTLGEGGDSTTALVETLLEQCDDMIHVLSLKGSLLYVSPAVEKILHYAPGELLGKNLQLVCHPSDWISVQRELKESSAGEKGEVNLLYRVRRKNAGFVWIEAHGRLHVESKGHKYVILLARERPVYRLSWTQLQQTGGFGDVEFWSKLSTDGTYLDVTSHVSNVLSRDSSSLVGSTIKDTVPASYVPTILSLLSDAARGKKSSLRHVMFRRNGAMVEPIEVVTHFWPTLPTAKSNGKLGKAIPETNFVLCQTNEVTSEEKRSTEARALEKKADRQFEGSNGTVGTGLSLPLQRPGLVRKRSATMFESSRSSSDSSNSSSVESTSHVPVIQSTYKMMHGHPAARRDNVFSEIDTSHSTSWLYEIHLLENLNKRLREERDSLVAARSAAGMPPLSPSKNSSGIGKKRARTFSESRQ